MILKSYISYLKDNPKGYWFKRKLYGWGWTPATKEGWLVILASIAAVALDVYFFGGDAEGGENAFHFWACLVLVVTILIFICYKKGEKPTWQWGLPKGHKN